MMSELAKAMNAVMKEVGYVQKERKAGLNYSFAGEAALIEALRPEMVKHGLTISPARMEVVKMESFQSGQGKPMTRVIVYAEYRLTHAPSGQSEIIGALGEGMDHGDKATLKAMTVAYKYVLRQGFLIETGDDPDNTPSTAYEDRRPQHQAPAKPQPQAPKTKTQDDWQTELESCLTLDSLKQVWNDVPAPLKKILEPVKDAVKKRIATQG